MGKRTRTNLDGLRKLRARFREMNERAVKVGVVGGDSSDLAVVAAANEFGTDKIPERSFMRSTLRENTDKYNKGLQRGLEAVLDDKISAKQALDLVGIEVVKDVQAKIVELDSPANAEATIEKKGSSNPLVDTGRLLQSIKHEVV